LQWKERTGEGGGNGGGGDGQAPAPPWKVPPFAFHDAQYV